MSIALIIRRYVNVLFSLRTAGVPPYPQFSCVIDALTPGDGIFKTDLATQQERSPFTPSVLSI